MPSSYESRHRPLSGAELERGDTEVLSVVNNDTIHIRESCGQAAVNAGIREFRFNRAVDQGCSQEEFFEVSKVRVLLDSALDGYASTVIAYGQTGSGKTFSMSGLEEKIASEDWVGSDNSNGIIPRSMAYLFDQIDSKATNSDKRYTVRASYSEIYNEQVYDLLNYNGRSLQVRWNSQKGFFVRDLFVVQCESLEDVMAVVSEGHRNRRVGSHELNKDSSRSHSLLTVHLEAESTDSLSKDSFVQYGKITFVDLAGSERLKDSRSEGTTKAETGAINKSLFTLSNVISALSDPRRSKASFVPYRNSKLTKLLMDSLGGTSKTLLIACCCPSSRFLEESLNTLNYATRAARIKNRPILQVDEKDQLINRLRQAIRLLKEENSTLKLELKKPNNSHGEVSERRSRVGLSNMSFHPITPAAVQSVRKNVLEEEGGSNSGDNLRPIPPEKAGSRRHEAISPRKQGANVRFPMLAGAEDYSREREEMQREIRNAVERGDAYMKKYESIAEENKHLSAKLEHLEKIFVHNEASSWRRKVVTSPTQKHRDQYSLEVDRSEAT